MKKLLQLLRDNAARQERAPLNLVRNEAGDEATLYIYDVIDSWFGVSALEVAKTIAGLTAGTLHVRLNTPGGDVFEGRAIRTALAQFAGKTIAHIDGLCASAGTTIADGADEIEIVQGGFYMIHNGWTMALGDKAELRKTADLLEKVDAAIVNDYAKRTGMPVADLVAMMDEETWFNAEEAVASGFATRLAPEGEKAKNATGKKWNLAAYAKAPKVLVDAPAPEPEPDYALLRAHNERRLQVLQFA